MIDFLKNWPKTRNFLNRCCGFFGENVTAHAGFGALVTLFIVLAGAAASLFTEAIRDTISLPEPKAGLGALFFWLLVVISLVLLLLNQRGINAKAKKDKDAIDTSLKKLDSAIARLNTLPSHDFLPSFRDTYAKSFEISMACALSDGSAAQSEKAIRYVLNAMCEIARDYDGVDQNAVYGANIMLFRPRGTPSRIVDSLGLEKVTVMHEKFVGALELISELSTSTASQGRVDENTQSISLPIPGEIRDRFDARKGMYKKVLIPGACTSFATASYEAYPSIDAYVDALHATSLSLDWIQHLEHYFTEGGGKHVRSFASLPIRELGSAPQPDAPSAQAATESSVAMPVACPLGTTPGYDSPSPASGQESPMPATGSSSALPLSSADGAPESSSQDVGGPQTSVPMAQSVVAVVNLHSSAPGLLSDNGGTLFAPLMGPFLSLLAILLALRDEGLGSSSGSAPPPNAGANVV